MRERSRADKFRGGFVGFPTEDISRPTKNTLNKDKLVIHQIAWTDLYRRMLFDYSIPSLINDYKRLVKAGVEVEWIIHLDDMNSKREYEGVTIQYNSFQDTIHFFNNTISVAVKAQREGAYLTLIAPDCIFGKNSLYNAYMLARNKDTSIAIAHPRALAEEFMAKYPPGLTYTNRELVTMVMQEDMMHPALRFAFDDLDSSFTNQGISIRRMGKNTYGVVHTLPSGVVFKFNENDINYLVGGSWGEIDRGLNVKLFAEKRIKLVGCSDMCFFIELTRPTHNFSFLYPNLKNNDRHMDERQNIFNNMVVVWIGE